MTTVIFECGCDALHVGQSFKQGLLVCPLHAEPVAPFERVPAPHRHRLVVVIELETRDPASPERFADWLSVLLEHDNRAVAVTMSLEERLPLEAVAE